MPAACSRESPAPQARSGAPQPLNQAGEGTQRADTTVLRIFSEFSQDSLIRDEEITVTGSGGRIVLKGSVRNPGARDHAVSIATRYKGTLALVDSIQVVASGSR